MFSSLPRVAGFFRFLSSLVLTSHQGSCREPLLFSRKWRYRSSLLLLPCPHSVACCLSGPLSAGARFPHCTVDTRSLGRVGGGVGLALGALGEPTDLVGRTPGCGLQTLVGGLPAECNQQDGCPLSGSLPMSSLPPAPSHGGLISVLRVLLEVNGFVPSSGVAGCSVTALLFPRGSRGHCRIRLWCFFAGRQCGAGSFSVATHLSYFFLLKCHAIIYPQKGWTSTDSLSCVGVCPGQHSSVFSPNHGKRGSGWFVGSPGYATRAEVRPPLTGCTGR